MMSYWDGAERATGERSWMLKQKSWMGQDLGSLKIDCLLLGSHETLPHLELNGIDELATLVTLVTPGLLIATEGTHTLHKAVSQKAGTALTPQLLHSILQHKTSVPQPLEDILGDSSKVSNGYEKDRLVEVGSGATLSPATPTRTQAHIVQTPKKSDRRLINAKAI